MTDHPTDGELARELKPCPFCGDTDLKVTRDREAYIGGCDWIVLCRGCGANGTNCASEKGAIIAWNARTPEQPANTDHTDAALAGLLPCPFCATEMHWHDNCFSHPRPAEGDCILHHYSFDKQKARAWNTRAPIERKG